MGLPGRPLPAGCEFRQGLEPATAWLFLVGFLHFTHANCRFFSGCCVLFATCFPVWFGGFRVLENTLVFKCLWFGRRACVKEQERRLWVLENSCGKGEQVIRVPAGRWSHTNNLWGSLLKNNPRAGHPERQGWVLANSEHLHLHPTRAVNVEHELKSSFRSSEGWAGRELPWRGTGRDCPWCWISAGTLWPR